MIVDYATFGFFFEQIAAQHPGINYFVFGDSTEYLAKNRALMSWPVLWLDEPGISLSKDSGMETFQSAVRLLANVPDDEFDDQRAMMNKLYRTIVQIKNIIQSTLEYWGYNSLDANLKLEPISGITHANEVGWELSFSIQVPTMDCDDCGKMMLPPIASFRWEYDNEFLNINIPNYLSHFLFKVKFIHENQGVWEVENQTQFAFDNILNLTIEVWFKLPDGNYIIRAVSIVEIGQICGISTPELIPPL